jgi:hypothetical protein
MIVVSASVFSLTAMFRGRFSPYQAIHLAPHVDGGVLAMATNHGHVACIARDPNGQADTTRTLLPSDELLKAAKPIKSAERYLSIDDSTALVTTRYKAASDKSIELPVTDSNLAFPPLTTILRGCIDHWSAAPETTTTAGRYDTTLLVQALKAAGECCDSLVLAAYDGGPLRLQSETLKLVVLLMPQTAAPIPQVPNWLTRHAHCP